MNLYVTKIDDVVRNGSWSLKFTLFFPMFKKGSRDLFEQPCLKAENIDSIEVNINVNGANGCVQ